MYSIPDTIYVVETLVGWRVLGYRESHRIAFHIHSFPETIHSDAQNLWDKLGNAGLPISSTGSLYGTRGIRVSGRRTKRGWVYHPVISSEKSDITARYRVEDKVLRLESVQINGVWSNRANSPISVWMFFDADDNMTVYNVHALVDGVEGTYYIKDDHYFITANIVLNLLQFS